MGARHDIEEIQRKLDELGPWFSYFDFGDGLYAKRVAPKGAPEAHRQFFEKQSIVGNAEYFKEREDRVFDALAAHVNPRECSLLDVGCADGYFAIAAAKRGFKRVVGVDPRPTSIECARYAAKLFGLDNVEFDIGSIYELDALKETFDVVLCLGVFYHLRDPLRGIEMVRSVSRKISFFAGHVMPGKEATFHFRTEDPTLVSSGDKEQILVPTYPAIKTALELQGFEQILDVFPSDGSESGWREILCVVNMLSLHRSLEKTTEHPSLNGAELTYSRLPSTLDAATLTSVLID